MTLNDNADNAARYRRDAAHHHPRVQQDPHGAWRWTCSCGSASCRTGQLPSSWRRAVVEALSHSTHLSA